jgi:hypothetical protein
MCDGAHSCVIWEDADMIMMLRVNYREAEAHSDNFNPGRNCFNETSLTESGTALLISGKSGQAVAQQASDAQASQEKNQELAARKKMLSADEMGTGSIGGLRLGQASEDLQINHKLDNYGHPAVPGRYIYRNKVEGNSICSTDDKTIWHITKEISEGKGPNKILFEELVSARANKYGQPEQVCQINLGSAETLPNYDPAIPQKDICGQCYVATLVNQDGFHPDGRSFRCAIWRNENKIYAIASYRSLTVSGNYRWEEGIWTALIDKSVMGKIHQAYLEKQDHVRMQIENEKKKAIEALDAK